MSSSERPRTRIGREQGPPENAEPAPGSERERGFADTDSWFADLGHGPHDPPGTTVRPADSTGAGAGGAQARRRDRHRDAIRRRRHTAVGLTVLVVLVIVLAVGGLPGGGLPAVPPAGLAGPAGVQAARLFAYAPGRDAAYIRRATAGSAHVIYTKSPGGAIATAARVAQYESLIETAVQGTDIPANVLEGLVFLESAGRSQVIAGSSAADAAGLTQILAGTGQDLLGMRINLTKSEKLTRQIATASRLDESARVAQLERARAAIDQRFDPAAELAATVRYLRIAEHDLGGRLDLAVTAYHAGIGNLQTVLADYDGGRTVPYVQLYFDIGPSHHGAAYDVLAGLGDDSALYYWRVLGAEQIMALYGTDRAALRRAAALQTGYVSNAEALVPPDSGASFADPGALAGAYASGAVTRLPVNPAALHLTYSPAMGAQAHAVGAPAALYRGLRPAALRMLIAIAGEVHALAPGGTPLTVAQTVIDGRYAKLSGAVDPPATTGYTFSVERHYRNEREAAAFQFVLDRLQALDLIAWTREPGVIEITVAPDAGRVLAAGVS